MAFLSLLFSSFPEAETDEASRMLRANAYLMALEGFSAGVIKAATGKIIRGQVPGIDPRYMPTPPQLRQLCDGIRAEEHRASLPKQDHRLALARYDAPPNPAVVAKLEALSKQLAASSAMDAAVLKPPPRARQERGEAAA